MKLTELTKLVPDYQQFSHGHQTIWMLDGQPSYKPAYLHGSAEDKARFDILYLPEGVPDEVIEVEGRSGEHPVEVDYDNIGGKGTLKCIMVWWVSVDHVCRRFRCLVCEENDLESLTYARRKQKEASNEI